MDVLCGELGLFTCQYCWNHPGREQAALFFHCFHLYGTGNAMNCDYLRFETYLGQPEYNLAAEKMWRVEKFSNLLGALPRVSARRGGAGRG